MTSKDKNFQSDFVDLYNEATEDYEFWSKDFNMHFGYYIPLKTKFLQRDSMLNEMNRQVFKRLDLPKNNPFLIDFGCGMGSTMLQGLKSNKNLKAIGLTLSDFQVREGNKRLKNHNGFITKEDYNCTSINNQSADGVCAVESLCHSGHSKNSLQEAYRILKKGGRFVIADAFLKKDHKSLCIGSNYCYKQLCKGWDLEGLGNINNVKEDLKAVGFSKIKIEDISFRVAPSVLHVPFAITGFILKKFLKKESLKPQSLNNLKGSFFALISGLHMRSFGYYLITAEK